MPLTEIDGEQIIAARLSGEPERKIARRPGITLADVRDALDRELLLLGGLEVLGELVPDFGVGESLVQVVPVVFLLEEAPLIGPLRSLLLESVAAISSAPADY